MDDPPAQAPDLEQLRQERAALAREVERLQGDLAAARRLAARRDEAAAARESRHAGRLAASEARTTAAEIDARAAWARAAELGTSLGRRIAEGQARLLASQAAVTSLERATEGLAAEHIAVALREADLRAVIESAIDCAIVTTDREGLVLTWNSGARRLLGWDEANVASLNLDALLPAEDRERGRLAADIGAALSGTRVSREGWLLRQDGGRVWAGIEAMAVRADGADEPVGVLWMLRDRSTARQAETALRESEARHRLLIESLTQAVWETDPDGVVVADSPSWRAYTGQALDEWLGYGWLDAIHPDERAYAERQWREAVAARGFVDADFRLRAPDGGWRWTNVRAAPVIDAAGRVEKWVGMNIDIHARRHAEAALREKDARYRALFESIETGFCIVELRFDAPDGRTDYRVVEANPAFYRHTGFPQAILGRWLREAAPALEEHWYERYGRVARTGQPERFEEGSDLLGRWFEVYAFRIDPPEACQVAILFSDVSTRHAAEVLELEIAARTAERDRIWETSPDLMVAVDSAGTVRRVNPAWTALLGYAPEELVGHQATEFVLPEDHAETVAAYELAAAGGRPRIVNRYRHKDGSTHWISWVAAPAQDVTYAIGRDVTRETEQEAALALAQAALRQSQKLEAIGHLTGGIAHDFNNMLQGVTGGLDMARRRIEAGRLEDAARYLDAARDAAGRAAGLTRRLLAFARRQTLDPRPLDPDALMQGMAEMLRRTMGPAITLELDLHDGFVTCDPNELESALLNLCINARDAMPEGGRLVISTRERSLSAADLAASPDVPPGTFVEIAVADTGTGMSPEVLEHALEPFFTTKPLGRGTGLGLSQVYGFVRQSGGAMRIESSPGQGTTVRLWLPFVARRAEGGDVPHEASEPAQHGGDATVLLVDDEAGVREPAVARLRDLGYTVVEAPDGPSAIRLLEGGLRPDLLVTDVGLPGGMDGTRVAEAARRLQPGLRVLFMTGYATAPLPPDAAVITKPFTMDALTTRVRRAIAGMMAGTQ